MISKIIDQLINSYKPKEALEKLEDYTKSMPDYFKKTFSLLSADYHKYVTEFIRGYDDPKDEKKVMLRMLDFSKAIDKYALDGEIPGVVDPPIIDPPNNKYKWPLIFITIAVLIAAAIWVKIEYDQEEAKSYKIELVNKANKAFNNKDYNSALVLYNELVELDSKNSIFISKRGYCNKVSNFYDKALIDYNKAIELANDEHNHYSNRAELYKDMKQYDNALKDYNKAWVLSNKNIPKYINNIGRVNIELNKKNEACIAFLKAKNMHFELGEINFKKYCKEKINPPEEDSVKVTQEIIFIKTDAWIKKNFFKHFNDNYFLAVNDMDESEVQFQLRSSRKHDESVIRNFKLKIGKEENISITPTLKIIITLKDIKRAGSRFSFNGKAAIFDFKILEDKTN